MCLVRQSVIDRHARKSGKLLGDLLAEPPIFDRIVHAAEHAGGVLHRFLVADMAATGAKNGDMRTLIVGRDLKAGAGPRRVLLEDQGDVPPRQTRLFGAGNLRCFELRRQLQQNADFSRREVIEG
jgi:hypothetical protein